MRRFFVFPIVGFLLLCFSLSAAAKFALPEFGENKAYINGYQDNTFGPDNSMTKAEACAMIARLTAGFDPGKAYSGAFADTAGWYESYISYLAQMGVLDRYETFFEPDRAITRAQFAELIFLAGEFPSSDAAAGFSDVPESHPFSEAIAGCVSNRLMGGYEDETFRPDNTITRAEAVTVINRALGTSRAAGRADDSVKTFSDISSHWAYAEILVAANSNCFAENGVLTVLPVLTVDPGRDAYLADFESKPFFAVDENTESFLWDCNAEEGGNGLLISGRGNRNSSLVLTSACEYPVRKILSYKDKYRYLRVYISNSSSFAVTVRLLLDGTALQGDVVVTDAYANTLDTDGEEGGVLLPAGFSGFVAYDASGIPDGVKTLSLAISSNIMQNDSYYVIDSICLSQKPYGNVKEKPKGSAGDVEQMKEELLSAMTKALSTKTVYREIPEFAPTAAGYTHIRAITYDGLTIGGRKTKTFAYIGFPEGASEDNPVPAIVLIHGGGGHPYLQWIKMWNDLGYAAIAMDTTGCYPTEVNACINEADNDKFKYGMYGVFLENGYADSPNGGGFSERPTLDQYWMYHALGKSILAHNLLLDDPRVDKDKIGVTGISWGGTITSILLGYDNRFAFAIPVYGAGYLCDSLTSHTATFTEGSKAKALWAAENRFSMAKMPILWLCYNDDNNFSILMNSKSYLDTAINNEKTMLSIVDKMGHSHSSGWRPSVGYVYADWIIKGDKGLVGFENQPQGREISCRLSNPAGIKIVTATLYYITEKMTYSAHDKFNTGRVLTYMDQFWQKAPLTCQNGVVSGQVPGDAYGYYIELSYTVNGKSCITSSSWVVPEQ